MKEGMMKEDTMKEGTMKEGAMKKQSRMEGAKDERANNTNYENPSAAATSPPYMSGSASTLTSAASVAIVSCGMGVVGAGLGVIFVGNEGGMAITNCHVGVIRAHAGMILSCDVGVITDHSCVLLPCCMGVVRFGQGVFDDPSLGFAGNSEFEIRAFLGADLTFCHDKRAPPLSDKQMRLSASARTSRFHLGQSVESPVSLTGWLFVLEPRDWRLDAESCTTSSGNDAASAMFTLAEFPDFNICATSPGISFPFRDTLCEYAELFGTKNAKYGRIKASPIPEPLREPHLTSRVTGS
ncbi:hypothetical protein VE04_06431 [Pseudogymnoascus sp. 24MN13]|nr:hypothetical protein VE04_06431 [Pseudogymnoascus sp. 24MN13]